MKHLIEVSLLVSVDIDITNCNDADIAAKKNKLKQYVVSRAREFEGYGINKDVITEVNQLTISSKQTF